MCLSVCLFDLVTKTNMYLMYANYVKKHKYFYQRRFCLKLAHKDKDHCFLFFLLLYFFNIWLSSIYFISLKHTINKPQIQTLIIAMVNHFLFSLCRIINSLQMISSLPIPRASPTRAGASLSLQYLFSKHSK